MPASPDICLVVASNDEVVLQRNLMQSAMVRGGTPVHVVRGAASAAAAYNGALDATTAPVVVFVHQDVYLPPLWEDRLRGQIAAMDRLHPEWAVLGVYGIAADGAHVGDVWTTNLDRRIGAPFADPVPAQSFDELLVVMRRAAGVRFDATLPGFHLYGTDIVQQARRQGRGAFVCWLPVVHNAKFQVTMGPDFAAAYRHQLHKWRHLLPLRTPVIWLRQHGLTLALYRLRLRRSLAGRRVEAGDPTTDPRVYAAACGWEADIATATGE